MANRRLGGMGGPQRGNRSFSQHQPFQGNNVNPWQGNMNSNSSLNQGGLLGQLANPQQLALALSNLLQPQQQMNNPPSLLSLNTSPAFSHQDRDSINRFGGNRGRSDFRRNEPYNKNRNGGGNWRQMDSNKNGPMGGGNRNNVNRGNFGRDNRKRSPNRSKFVKDDREKQAQLRKNDKNEKKEEKPASKEVTLNSGDISMEDSRDEDGHEETKREWKDEKNISEEKKEDSIADEDDEEIKKDGPKDLDGRYFGVAQKFLHCFVCNKDMWDGESFQKHIRGRAHKQMLQSLEESFHITVNILRENMRLSEEKKVIELNRMHRLNKNKFNRKFQEPESHCNMCDLKFLGKIITHRKTEGHQRLKRFLHPNCGICHKEFPSRMDWVDHRLTPEHLRQLNEVLENKSGKENGEIIENKLELNLEPLLEESMEMEDEHPILELSDDLVNLQSRMPAYKRHRPIATESLKPFTGFMCNICLRSFENEEYAKTHLKTEAHYFNFVEAVKMKYKQQNEEAQAKEAENKKRKRNEEAEEKEKVAEAKIENTTIDKEDMYDPEEACKEEEEDNKQEQSIEGEGDGDEEGGEEEQDNVVNVDNVLEVKVEEEETNLEAEEVPAPPPAPIITKVESLATVIIPQIPLLRQARRSNVKNGAGPKSKKTRKNM